MFVNKLLYIIHAIAYPVAFVLPFWAFLTGCFVYYVIIKHYKGRLLTIYQHSRGGLKHLDKGFTQHQFKKILGIDLSERGVKWFGKISFAILVAVSFWMNFLVN